MEARERRLGMGVWRGGAPPRQEGRRRRRRRRRRRKNSLPGPGQVFHRAQGLNIPFGQSPHFDISPLPPPLTPTIVYAISYKTNMQYINLTFPDLKF